MLFFFFGDGEEYAKDVSLNRKSCKHKAILIPASFSRHTINQRNHEKQ